MVHEFVNFTRKDRPKPKINDGDVLIECNISQRNPDTLVFAGKSNLTIIGGNVTNCTLPPDTKYGGCNPDVKAPCRARNVYEEILNPDSGRMELQFKTSLGRVEIPANQLLTKPERKILFNSIGPQLKNLKIKLAYTKEIKKTQV